MWHSKILWYFSMRFPNRPVVILNLMVCGCISQRVVAVIKLTAEALESGIGG